ncbi:MAG TPA: tRNA (N(6)-L-threonylcarbamoyladenosine(37)-C(2))-methylthiotransferase MtaB [bacterium]|nr:tRNA (N(6)-L-threonylcarbamoyladenosine(37)-C(2))-methylthiotransferase MtaB [bacterium]
MPSVLFLTFGCKLNQAETAQLNHLFTSEGYELARSAAQADVVVVNTCTVTGRSASKCRQAIHRTVRENPRAVLIAAGCYAQVNAEELAACPGVDYILGTDEKYRIFDFLNDLEKKKTPCIQISRDFPKQARTGTACFPGHTRSFIKIQDGCDRACSYCIVPHARGPVRSVPLHAVQKQARYFSARGVKEIVLTGVHIGDYGKDRDGQSHLPELLDCLADTPVRIRLSSLNIEDLTDALFTRLEKHPRICRHLHIPLQSGSDTILQTMRRSYTAREFREAVLRIQDRLGPIGLGTDIIAGFPGETDDLFMETLNFCRSLPFTYMHVFPYSRRPGTEAAAMKETVSPAIRRERARRLRLLGEEKSSLFQRSMPGRTVEVLFEKQTAPHRFNGLSSEYLRVEVSGEGLHNALRTVVVEECENTVLKGRLVGGPAEPGCGP